MFQLVLPGLQLLIALFHSSNCESTNTSTHNEIIFNYHSKILLAKSFESVQLVLPYPQFDATFEEYIQSIANKIDQLWNHPNYGCELNYNNITSLNFTANWIHHEVVAEPSRVLSDLHRFKSEVTHLFPDTLPPVHRNKRAIPLVLAAGAATGIFGLGFGLKDKISCTLGRIFDGCNKIAQENRHAIVETINHVNFVKSAWVEVQNATNEKLFIGTELRDLRETQIKS